MKVKRTGVLSVVLAVVLATNSGCFSSLSRADFGGGRRSSPDASDVVLDIVTSPLLISVLALFGVYCGAEALGDGIEDVDAYFKRKIANRKKPVSVEAGPKAPQVTPESVVRQTTAAKSPEKQRADARTAPGSGAEAAK